jgi:putative peptidoglycan lipid II flippase
VTPTCTRTSEGLLRSSRTMALGTMASRATGFLRMVVLAAAIGSMSLAEAYNVANVLPNIIYELLLGGVLTSVVVPLLVSATKADVDAGAPGPPGERYARQLLTLVALLLGGATLLAVLAAPALLALYGPVSGPQHDLAVQFARFFLPQILFLGVGATIGAILNTRGRFGPPMWAPVLNNVVVIITLVVFLAQTVGEGRADLLPLSTAQLLTLGIGTTAGIVVQTVALLPALRATGFTLRPLLGLPLADLRRAGRLAGWVLVYVAANQVALLIVVRLARAAGNTSGPGSGIGYSAYLYAFTIFSLPHAIVGVSIITALLPRMSRAALDHRLDRLWGDLAGGLRLAGVVVVPAACALLVLGPLIGTVIYGHGRVGAADGRAIGLVLAGFAVGLVPFSVFQLHLRAFYAQGDTRTPALVNVAVNAVNIAVDLLAYAALPQRWRVVGLAVGYSTSYAVGALLTSRLLAERLPQTRPEHVLRTYVRLGTAGICGSVAALVVAVGVALPLPGGFAAGPLSAGIALAVAIPIGGAVYLLTARRLRVAEVAQLTALLPGRLSGRLPAGGGRDSRLR